MGEHKGEQRSVLQGFIPYLSFRAATLSLASGTSGRAGSAAFQREAVIAQKLSLQVIH
ncbi:MAG: hypothetical protein JRF49_05735 [Deltaproteobacteria bacterium]|nr:hypothetical protein [Deltaproteobacteria bacterium]